MAGEDWRTHRGALVASDAGGVGAGTAREEGEEDGEAALVEGLVEEGAVGLVGLVEFGLILVLRRRQLGHLLVEVDEAALDDADDRVQVPDPDRRHQAPVQLQGRQQS